MARLVNGMGFYFASCMWSSPRTVSARGSILEAGGAPAATARPDQDVALRFQMAHDRRGSLITAFGKEKQS
jgi:hypothetical protein